MSDLLLPFCDYVSPSHRLKRIVAIEIINLDPSVAKHQFVHGLSFTLCFLLVPDTYRIACAFNIFDHRLLKIVQIDVQAVHPYGCSIVELWPIIILEK